jgi:hypothetical protein
VDESAVIQSGVSAWYGRWEIKLVLAVKGLAKVCECYVDRHFHTIVYHVGQVYLIRVRACFLRKSAKRAEQG